MEISRVGPILALVVTGLGFVLSIVWLLFLVLGTKVPARDEQPHKIKFKDLEITTDRVVMLLIVCVFAMVLPLGGYYWLTYKVFQDAQLHLIATVEDVPGKYAAEAEVVLVRFEGGREEPQCPERKTINGEFSCRMSLRSLRDVFELRIKAGVRSRIIPVTPTDQHIIVTLKER